MILLILFLTGLTLPFKSCLLNNDEELIKKIINDIEINTPNYTKFSNYVSNIKDSIHWGVVAICGQRIK